MELNKQVDALDCFVKATVLDPSNEDFLNNKNMALTSLGREPEKKMVFPVAK
jgi:hypothetical protein